jgi:cell division protein FtsZ
VIAAGFDGGQPPARRDNVLGSSSSKREEPATPARTVTEPVRPAFGGLGSVTPRETAQAQAAEETASAHRPSMSEYSSNPGGSPQVPPSRPYDTQAEELDVPDFLK